MTRVVTVDQNDSPINLKTYEELRYEDIYRVTALWLVDSGKGECLITQRQFSKHNDPGKWMVAVAGTVEEGEYYDDNMVKEIEEEIGLNNLSLRKLTKMYIDEGKHRFFTQWFTADVDKDSVEIVIQEDEVAGYQWIKVEKLISWMNEKPEDFVPSMKSSLEAIGVIDD